MFGQQLLVDSWLVVEPLQKAMRHQFDQILVAGVVLAEQHQVMVGFFAFVRSAIRVAATGDVNLASYDGLDTFLSAVS